MYDLVFRRPCCGVSVTVGCTPNGDEAYAQEGALRLLRGMCKCVGKETPTTVHYVPSQWSYAPHNR